MLRIEHIRCPARCAARALCTDTNVQLLRATYPLRMKFA